MKAQFKQKIFLYFFIIFALFAASIIILEQREEQKHNTQQLIARLDGYADIIDKHVQLRNSENMPKVDKLINILPEQIRITLVDAQGKVLYDNDKDVKDISTLENHLDRPEIKTAKYLNKGDNIRFSASLQQEYLYYAKKYDNYYVRVALPYNKSTKAMLEADSYFIYAVGLLFIVGLLLLNYVAGRFGKSIAKLKSYTSLVKNGYTIPDEISFPNDELGEIGAQIVEIVNDKEKAKRAVTAEREKLIRHFNYSEEGLAVFSNSFEIIYSNTHFIRYINNLSNTPIVNIESLFRHEEFAFIIDFINLNKGKQDYKITQMKKGAKIYQVQVISYLDDSFEVIVKDITRAEKNRILKQEMTSNIAHELRTPITSLRGYLETLAEQDVPADKQQIFLEKAYNQSIRLSNLIQDISLISKMEESVEQFTREEVNLFQLINEVRINHIDKLSSQKLVIDIGKNVIVQGNYTLLYSIFSNLVENAINYAGDDVEIGIKQYLTDNKFLYFNFYDTGVGVEEEHLGRLFERFYRDSAGRTRNTGGSGLGLSIVRNAVVFHGGEIEVRNRQGGGLEYLFTLKLAS